MKKSEQRTSEWWYSLSVKIIGYPFLVLTVIVLTMLLIIYNFDLEYVMDVIQYPLLIIFVSCIGICIALSIVISAKGSRTELREKEQGKDSEIQ